MIDSIIEKDRGLFSYTELKNDNKNYVIESSVSNCIKETAYMPIAMKYGNCGIHLSNISKNSVYSSSAFFIYLAKGLNVINFSTFENSTSNSICLEHNSANDGYLDYFCNIVNNPQKTSQWGVILIGSVVTMENCTILGPFGEGPAAYVLGSLKMINCNVDKDFSTSRNKASTLNVVTTKVLNILHHLSTYKCDAVLKLDDINNNIVTDIFRPNEYCLYVFPYSLFMCSSL